MDWSTGGFGKLVLYCLAVSSLLAAFTAGRYIDAPVAWAGGVEDAPLRPGVVTVLTFARLKGFHSDIDPKYSFDLDAISHPFETYPGVHDPRVYHAEWQGWTGKEWKKYSADFEVNGSTYVMPIWRADGEARVVYVSDHLSERRFWDAIGAEHDRRR